MAMALTLISVRQQLHRGCDPTQLPEDDHVLQGKTGCKLFFIVEVPLPAATQCHDKGRITLQSDDDCSVSSVYHVDISVTECRVGAVIAPTDLVIKTSDMVGKQRLEFSLKPLPNAWTRSFKIAWSGGGIEGSEGCCTIQVSEMRKRRRIERGSSGGGAAAGGGGAVATDPLPDAPALGGEPELKAAWDLLARIELVITCMEVGNQVDECVKMTLEQLKAAVEAFQEHPAPC